MGGVKRSKNKDPFSVTVALATVNGDDNESTEEIMNHSSGSHSGAVKSTRDHSPPSSGDLERGVSKHSRNMVIHVNKQIYVESAERSGMQKRGVEKWEDSYERI